ncbi:MAG: hypothetical protein J1F39_01925 [Clostridiales bacterium]|nr:hypothetical protein [Clostridiales bacterium]
MGVFDFSKVENIIFVASTGVASLLMLVFLLTAIIKGKHKTGAFDIIARILAVLVFIAALALSAAAVLSMLNGAYRIDATAEEASLVFGETVIALPLPQYFVILKDLIGDVLCFAPALLSLLVLIVDGALARKNYEAPAKGKAKKPAVDNRTPEQKKRDAEIERIRRLASSAVKKTSAAAGDTARDSAKDKAEPAKTEAPAAAQEKEESADFDWRVSPPPKPQQTEFVGLSEESGNDSFDSFDSDFEETASPKGDGAFDSFTVSESGGDEEEKPVDSFESESEENNEYVVEEEEPEQDSYDETVSSEADQTEDIGESVGGYDEQVAEGETEEQYETEEEEAEQDTYDEQDAYDEEETDSEAEQGEFTETVDTLYNPDETDIPNAESAQNVEPYSVNDTEDVESLYNPNETDIYGDEQYGNSDDAAEESDDNVEEVAIGGESDIDEYEEYDDSDETDGVSEQSYDETVADGYDETEDFGIGSDDDIEPNRDIYIPEIRTITRQRTDSTEQEPETAYSQEDESDEPLVLDEPVLDEPIIPEEPTVEEPAVEVPERPVYTAPEKPVYEEPVKPVKPAEPVRHTPPPARPEPPRPAAETKRPERRVGPDPNAKSAHDETVKKKIEQVRLAHETEAAKRRESVKKPTEKVEPKAARPSGRSAIPVDVPKKTVSSSRQTGGARTTGETSDKKKLPLTRRYVIINRTNAVNVFNDYLKERGKEKLDSMVTTIILK